MTWRGLLARAASASLAATLVAACTKCASNPPPSPVIGVPGDPTATAARKQQALELTETAFEGGFKTGWQDWGWASVRETAGPGPARVNFSNWGGWILARPGLKGPFGALVFRVKEPSGEGEFLEVRVDSGTQQTFPRVKVGAQYKAELEDGWIEVRIPMIELNPDGVPFDRIILRAFRDVPSNLTQLDKIGFTKPDPNAAAARLNATSYSAANARPGKVQIACNARATKVSPLIYGIAYNFMSDDNAAHQWQMGATIRRWGGNPTSRYNWEIHAWNLDSDWFYENVAVKPYTKFLADDASHGIMSALSVPMLGWVAKDTTSHSFPVSVYGSQAATDQWRPEAGNGKRADGKDIAPGPQTRTSVAVSPAWIKKWVEAIRSEDKKTGKRSVHQYILDNEPALWQNTHRDVRHEPLGYDELVERTIQYGTAIREADHDAIIAGPAEWGWLGYLYSGKDAVNSFRDKADRKAHGDVPLIEWYLRKLREHEQKTGVRVLDVVDLHYYPQSDNVYGGGQGGTDAKTAALRLRSTRSLWDPTYTDESWIKEQIRLLPRMKEWVEKNYPGRGLSIGEWSFGGESHMSGALSAAEALGRFAQFGVMSAFYWTYPQAGSPTIQAFLAYRNFDGKGGRFLDWYLPSTTAETDATVFASRDESGKRVVAIAINMSPDNAVNAKVELTGCGAHTARRVYGHMKGAGGLVAGEAAQAGPATFEQILPPYSITVLDLELAEAMPGALEK